MLFIIDLFQILTKNSLFVIFVYLTIWTITGLYDTPLSQQGDYNTTWEMIVIKTSELGATRIVLRSLFKIKKCVY